MINSTNNSVPVLANALPTANPTPGIKKTQGVVINEIPTQKSSTVEISPTVNLLKEFGPTSVQFQVNPETGKSIVTVVSKESGEIIRQIPSPISVSLEKSLNTNPVGKSFIDTKA